MKTIILAIITGITTVISNTAFSEIISCPAIYSVPPFVKAVTPVPFPQCYYTGKATIKTKKGHCKQIQKKLIHRFNKQLKPKPKLKQLPNWHCTYNVQNKHKYTFTFAPLN